jgi:poly-gamma-glutamate synthesis protein (capsule biosynthesis protein)
LELYRGRPILYGCGDFLTDYEGIEGYEQFRGDLAAMYFVTLVPGGCEEARPARMRLALLQARQFRLRRVCATDAHWTWQMLQREGARFGTEVLLNDDNSLTVRSA